MGPSGLLHGGPAFVRGCLCPGPIQGRPSWPAPTFRGELRAKTMLGPPGPITHPNVIPAAGADHRVHGPPGRQASRGEPAPSTQHLWRRVQTPSPQPRSTPTSTAQIPCGLWASCAAAPFTDQETEVQGPGHSSRVSPAWGQGARRQPNPGLQCSRPPVTSVCQESAPARRPFHTGAHTGSHSVLCQRHFSGVKTEPRRQEGPTEDSTSHLPVWLPVLRAVGGVRPEETGSGRGHSSSPVHSPRAPRAAAPQGPTGCTLCLCPAPRPPGQAVRGWAALLGQEGLSEGQEGLIQRCRPLQLPLGRGARCLVSPRRRVPTAAPPAPGEAAWAPALCPHPWPGQRGSPAPMSHPREVHPMCPAGRGLCVCSHCKRKKCPPAKVLRPPAKWIPRVFSRQIRN